MTLRHTPLVNADRLTSPQSYRQLSRREQDHDFRTRLENLIGHERFTAVCQTLAVEGAVSGTGLLTTPRFDRFRQVYDAEMAASGSRGSLHSYLNVASSRPLLDNPGLWEAIAHPLFVAAVAHAIGGPVKLIDLRAKDTYPVDVVARDNTLHLDNSPFIDEYKVIVTWSLGGTDGPSGQGLTYLPRTNSLFRQCFVNADGSVWSDEDACVFPSAARVDEAIAAQASFLGESIPGPLVVNLTDLRAPCHTVFAASRLVHHRYRTSTGAARSAVMASFHRTEDSPEPSAAHGLALGDSRGRFLATVRRELPRIRAALDRPSLIVNARHHTLTGASLDKWYARQSAGVTLNDLRERHVRHAAGMRGIVQRLRYDLQGPLNMPFFADLREARRKRARIWLREISASDLADIVAVEWTRSPSASSFSVDLHECLVDLGRLLSGIPGGVASGGETARSLPGFVDDLATTVGWLGDDMDSAVTATAFGFLAAAVGTRWFVLGEAGRRVTAQLFGRYRDLVGQDP
jgi:hypothetical protein